jgi:hypothetical protein
LVFKSDYDPDPELSVFEIGATYRIHLEDSADGTRMASLWKFGITQDAVSSRASPSLTHATIKLPLD